MKPCLKSNYFTLFLNTTNNYLVNCKNKLKTCK